MNFYFTYYQCQWLKFSFLKSSHKSKGSLKVKCNVKCCSSFVMHW